MRYVASWFSTILRSLGWWKRHRSGIRGKGDSARFGNHHRSAGSWGGITPVPALGDNSGTNRLRISIRTALKSIRHRTRQFAPRINFASPTKEDSTCAAVRRLRCIFRRSYLWSFSGERRQPVVRAESRVCTLLPWQTFRLAPRY